MNTHAWIVPVWTAQPKGETTLSVFVAGFATACEARDAVNLLISSVDAEKVGDPVEISQLTATALNVTPGAVWRL